jgi:diguanylate cyclase (GGDEF)-like protein
MDSPEIPLDEEQRMVALRSTGALFSPAEERFDRITRLASKLLGTPIALVSLVADKCQWFKSAQGLSAPETSREISFCGHAILEDETFLVEDATKDPRFSDNPLVTGDPSIRFYAGHPLHTSDGSRVGTLCVIDRKPRKFTQEQIQILRDLAAIAESELQRGQLNDSQFMLIKERDDMKLRASIDGLTRLWSRAAIGELLDTEILNSSQDAPFCLAMIDVDHFKNINDSYGHQTGDEVLMEIANRIRRAVRDFDLVGRWGGEEFLVLFNNCSLVAAKIVCDRIRGLICENPIRTPSGGIKVTVSIGLSEWNIRFQSPKNLIAAADQALYSAKGNGRNRVEVQ